MMLSSQSQSQVSASSSSSVTKSALLDRKIEECTAGLLASLIKQLHSIGDDNAATVVKYIEVMKTEVNLSDHYRNDL
ncbi:MAG: hypothetical protein WCC82_06935, partial [Nitrososphaeraceae archaeon]